MQTYILEDTYVEDMLLWPVKVAMTEAWDQYLTPDRQQKKKKQWITNGMLELL